MKRVILPVLMLTMSTAFSDAVDIHHDDGVKTKIRTDQDGIKVEHIDKETQEVRGTEGWGKDYTVKDVFETHNTEGAVVNELDPIVEQIESSMENESPEQDSESVVED